MDFAFSELDGALLRDDDSVLALAASVRDRARSGASPELLHPDAFALAHEMYLRRAQPTGQPAFHRLRAASLEAADALFESAHGVQAASRQDFDRATAALAIRCYSGDETREGTVLLSRLWGIVRRRDPSAARGGPRRAWSTSSTFCAPRSGRRGRSVRRRICRSVPSRRSPMI